MIKFYSQVLACLSSFAVIFAGVAFSPTHAGSNDDFTLPAPTVLSPKAVFTRRLLSPSPVSVDSFSDHFVSLCRYYNFDPMFILAVIDQESSFRTDAISSAGAVGLMQLMPPTATVVLKALRKQGLHRWDSLRRRNLHNLEDPYVNVALGITYLSLLRGKVRDDMPHGYSADYYILAAYNIGPARLKELVARKGFRPVETKRYFENIRRQVYLYRFGGAKT